MNELIAEIAIYLGIAAGLGLLIGYLIWGIPGRARIAAARAQGAASARTSMDGDAALHDQLEACARARDQLEKRVEQLNKRLATRAPASARSRNGAADPMPLLEHKRIQTKVVAVPDPVPGSTFERIRKRPAPADEPERVVPIFREDRSSAKSSPTGAEGTAAPAPERPRETPDEPKPDPPSDDAPRASKPRPDTAPEPAASELRPDKDPIVRILLKEPPDKPDDLSRIEGVGQRMAKTLNDYGIYLYSQIAMLSADEVDTVNAAIGAYPGRIRQDGWVEQARELHRLKYNEGSDT